jgi:hypothetical protein
VRKTHPLILLAAVLSASCASDSGARKSSTSAPTLKPLSQRLEEQNGYAKDAKGNWVPRNDKRSSFENQGEAAYFKKDFKKKDYKTGDYAKKSWWGNKQYDRRSYAGKTDGSRFEKASALQGQGAREAGSAADVPGAYQTDNYATNSARETTSSAIAKPSNDGIENRRGVFQPPEIIDWREQRSLSVDQSRGILGR